jgi:aerotolerance-related exported protein
MRAFMLACALLLVAVELSFAQKDASYIRKGNSEFGKGKFYEAELEYRKALEQDGSSTKAQFNLGGALFRQEKLDESLKSFSTIAERNDVTEAVRASSLYNLGNILFKQEHYKESVEAYKHALRLDPGAEDIKYNLSAALRKLKEQENQQNQNKDQNQDQNNDNQQDKNSGGEGDNKQENNQDKNNQNNANNNDKQQNQGDNKEQNKKGGTDQQQQGAQGQQKERAGMTQEEAAQLLKALENQENALQAKIQKEKAKSAKKTKQEKDW